MTTVGQIEKRTQARVVALFRERLGYDYLGDRSDGLFQAICRVNRLDGDDKEYGTIIDYKDLFKRLEGAVGDYTSGALDGYDKDDVKGAVGEPSG